MNADIEVSSSPLPSGEDDRDFVRALARGLSVLEAFGADRPAMTLSEIAKIVGLSRGSTRRLLLTLIHLGYLGSVDGRFSLRPRALRLGYGYLSALPVWGAARPVIEDVAAKTGQSCSIAVLDGSEIVYVARVAARRIVNDYLPVGTRLAAHATSMGKVLLGGLSAPAFDAWVSRAVLVRFTDTTITDTALFRRHVDVVRAQGWAVNDEEIETGLRSVAVAIPGPSGPAAAINVSVSASAVSVEQLVDFVPILRLAADVIGDITRLPHPPR